MIKKYVLMSLLLSLAFFGLHANEEVDYEFKGSHFVASYVGCNHDKLANVEALKTAFLLAVHACGATVLEAVDYIFPPEGLTMLALLSESHASIHTYPEHNACFIDLFTCGTKCSAENFDRILREYLEPAEVHANLLPRGESGMQTH